MSDVAAPTPAKKAAAKPKKVAEHPPVAEMVSSAISNLKDKKGSSLAAIKKYVAANNKVDMDRIASFIRRYLKKAVADGKLTQTKGTGASGSFKLAKPEKVEKKPKAKPAAKPKVAKPKAAKKAKTPKKAAKKPAAKKDVKKTPKKAAKKATKSPKKEKKAKATKPKKPMAKTSKSPKKAAKKPAAKKTAKK
jgi:histone H1/5